MLNTLSIASQGYLTKYKKSLSVGVDGYLYKKVSVTKPPLKPVYKPDNVKKASGMQFNDDDEVLMILKIFLECQQLK